MHLLTKSGEQIRLTPLTMNLTAAPRTNNLRVEVAADPARDPIGTGSLVARATRGFFELGRRAGAMAPPAPPKGPPPVTFRDEASGALRVVYREVVVRFKPRVARGNAQAAPCRARVRGAAAQRVRARPVRRLSPGPQVRRRGIARNRQRVDGARRSCVRHAEFRLAVLAPGGVAGHSGGAVAPAQQGHGRRDQGRGRRRAGRLEDHARQARHRGRGARRRRRRRPSEPQVEDLEEPRQERAGSRRARFLRAERRSGPIRSSAEAVPASRSTRCRATTSTARHARA